MSKSDTDFLKDYIASNNIAVATRPVVTQQQDATKQLQDVVRTSENANNAEKSERAVTRTDDKRLRRLQRRAGEIEIATTLTAQEQQERDEQLQEDEKEKQRQQNVVPRARYALQSASNAVQPAIDTVASAKTPGGIGVLLLILGVLLFTVVQVNASGDTRLKQFWYMLNGRATIIGRQNVMVGTGASGTFGQPGQTGQPTTNTNQNSVQQQTLPSTASTSVVQESFDVYHTGSARAF